MAWSPEQYGKFRDERAEPFNDLVALGAWRSSLRMIDLGCGTGELTAKLLDLSPGATVTGLDSSEPMLAKARKLERPGLAFERDDIESWIRRPSSYDVVFSHAALQWVEDHPRLFRELASRVAPGGQLLVQMPSNHDHVSHVLVRELAATPLWSERLGGFVRRAPVLSIDAYAELLHAAGLSKPTVIEKVYGHVLPDAEGVLEWVKGTLLVPYLERLAPRSAGRREAPSEDALTQEFLVAILARFRDAMPERPYYYAYRRTLIAARRPA